jgi:phospholipid/cholesterol/gamma-HCH transport system substrate-binding protein
MEKPNQKGSDNFVVGLFVSVALLVVSGFVVFMGGTSSFIGEVKFKTRFKDVRGLNTGAPVFLAGIQVGRVSRFQFPEPGDQSISKDDILTELAIFSEHAPRIKVDSMATVSTQGVLGDKIIAIVPGKPESPSLNPNEFMLAEQPRDLGEYFQKGGSLVENLNLAAENLNALLEQMRKSGDLAKTMAHLEETTQNLSVLTANLRQENSTLGNMIRGGQKDSLGPAIESFKNILAKIERGEGTLGALINDSALHEDLRVLLGGAQRSTAVRFLVRQAISSGEKASVDPKLKTDEKKK